MTSAKMVSELYGLSYEVKHSRGRISCTFSFVLEFVAKAQNPSVSGVLLMGLSDEFLLLPVTAVKHCPSQ